MFRFPPCAMSRGFNHALLCALPVMGGCAGLSGPDAFAMANSAAQTYATIKQANAQVKLLKVQTESVKAQMPTPGVATMAPAPLGSEPMQSRRPAIARVRSDGR